MDLQRSYRLDPQVALRPEPFGALAYHFGNRRLTFLRSPDVVAVVRALDDAATVQAALEQCGIEPRRWPAFERALGTLEASDMLHLSEGEAGRAA